MPRKVKDRNLDSREARSKLRARGMPYYRALDRTLHLGYRRLKGRPGSWWARYYLGDQHYELEALGTADDMSNADGRTILDFFQAQSKARAAMAERAKATAAPDGKVITVDLALDRYQENLAARGAETANVARVRVHLAEDMPSRSIASLTAHDLEAWRNGLLAKMRAASVNRVCNVLRAALNLAADGIEGQSRSAWESGLKAIPDASEARNVVISDAEVRRVVAEALKESTEFGIFVEAAAVTGARPSQLSRVLIRDLKVDTVDMPSSRKGRGKKKITHRQIPIPLSFADRLRQAAAGRDANAPLFSRPDGEPWCKSDHARPFRRTAKRAKLDPAQVTIYALRHSSITRMLTASVPIRVIAALHDTSVQMIEKNYSVHIDKHVDQIVRPALIDFGSATTRRGNVTPISVRR